MGAGCSGGGGGSRARNQSLAKGKLGGQLGWWRGPVLPLRMCDFFPQEALFRLLFLGEFQKKYFTAETPHTEEFYLREVLGLVSWGKKSLDMLVKS